MAEADLPDDGERMIPSYHKGRMIYGEHIARYESVKPLVKNKTVLDIACGSGYGSRLLSESASSVTGVDVSEKAVAYAKQNYEARKLKFTAGSATDIPLEDNSIDVVVSFETIEHIKDYKKFLAEVKRVMKDGGLFIVSTPNDAQYVESNPFHVHEFRYDEIIRLLKTEFKNIEPYFQSTWLYNSILNAKLSGSEWQQPVETISTIASRPDEAVYFILMCSEKKLPVLGPLGSISEVWKAREIQLREKMVNDKQKLSEQHIKNLSEKIAMLEAELRDIKSSRAWRAASKLNSVKKLFS